MGMLGHAIVRVGWSVLRTCIRRQPFQCPQEISHAANLESQRENGVCFFRQLRCYETSIFPVCRFPPRQLPVMGAGAHWRPGTHGSFRCAARSKRHSASNQSRTPPWTTILPDFPNRGATMIVAGGVFYGVGDGDEFRPEDAASMADNVFIRDCVICTTPKWTQPIPCCVVDHRDRPCRSLPRPLPPPYSRRMPSR